MYIIFHTIYYKVKNKTISHYQLSVDQRDRGPTVSKGWTNGLPWLGGKSGKCNEIRRIVLANPSFFQIGTTNPNLIFFWVY